MKIGHIYKKGRSYWLCLYVGKKQFRIWNEDLYTLLNMSSFERTTERELNLSKYTHIGKAIDLIKG